MDTLGAPYISWQPLGPLLKVKLLVGYMCVSICRVGTADLRQNVCHCMSYLAGYIHQIPRNPLK